MLTFLLLCLVQCLVAWPMVLGFFIPGCHKCNCTTFCRGNCSDNVTSATVTITGVSNDSCTSCSSYNGTYIIDSLPPGLAASVCGKSVPVSPDPCNISGQAGAVSFVIGLSGVTVEYRVQLFINNNSTPNVYWSRTFTAPPITCAGTYSIPRVGVFTTTCSHDGSSAEVTVA